MKQAVCAVLGLCKSWTLTLSEIRFKAMESLSEVLSLPIVRSRSQRGTERNQEQLGSYHPLVK